MNQTMPKSLKMRQIALYGKLKISLPVFLMNFGTNPIAKCLCGSTSTTSLHSLDQWYINPRVYIQPSFHEKDLNNLDVQSNKRLTREDIGRYFDMLKRKITDYNDELTDNILLQKPEKCEWTRFTLILAQHRHLHSHMGMLMGFIIKDTGIK